MCSPQTIVAALTGAPEADQCRHAPAGDTPSGPGPGISRRHAVRAALAGALGITAGTALSGGRAEAAPTAPAFPPHGFQVRDLTHPLSEDFPVFRLYVDRPSQRQVAYEWLHGFNSAEWTFNEHSGTHMDVPAHSKDGLLTADEIAAEDLVAPLCVVRIAERAWRDNTTELTVADLQDWERRNGPIPERAFVAMDTEWYRRVHDPDAYLGFDPIRLMLAVPGISPEAADFLINKRSIVGFGSDTCSLDVGTRVTPLVHRMLLTTGRYGLENLAALNTVPESGATLVVGAAKLKGGFGAPVRALAFF